MYSKSASLAKSGRAVRRPGKTASLFKRNAAAWALLAPSVAALVVVMWRPIVQAVGWSFFKMKGYDLVSFNGLQNYIDVLTDATFMKTLLNTFSYVLWSLVIGFVPPIAVAVALNEMCHFKGPFKFSLYFPAITPLAATALIWYFLFQPGEAGALNALLGGLGFAPSNWLSDPRMTIPLIIFTMTWKNLGATMLVYLASLQGVNQELYEAATIDGAGVRRKLWHITFPQIAPVVVLMLVRHIVSVFQVMIEPLIMTDGGPNNASLSVNLSADYYAFRFLTADKALALGVLTFTALFFLTIFYFAVKKRVEDF
jgi:multiple sugar transport system permease protein